VYESTFLEGFFLGESSPALSGKVWKNNCRSSCSEPELLKDGLHTGANGGVVPIERSGIVRTAWWLQILAAANNGLMALFPRATSESIRRLAAYPVAFIRAKVCWLLTKILGSFEGRWFGCPHVQQFSAAWIQTQTARNRFSI
jgi:hypothetical protein